MSAAIDRFGPGEHLVWQGRPHWYAMARDVLHVRPIALYFAAIWIWHAAGNRADGLTPLDTINAGLPLALVEAIVLGACLAFAWGLARTTQYTITNSRCIMRFGLALTATLSVPHRQIATVAIAERGDGTGDLPMQLKPGKRLGYVKLWPHVRPWRTAHPVPMLRCVPDAARVGALLSQAVEAVNAGRRYFPAAASRPAELQAPAAGAPAHG